VSRTGRVSRLAVTGVLAAAVLAGCAPGGVDGDLTDDWKGPGELKPFTPASGVCHAGGLAEVAPAAGYDPIDCTKSHQTETVHVGTLRGEHAEGSTPPTAGSPAVAAAYTECEQAARSYLGDDWRAGQMWLGIALPSSKGWGGGARWFRCDMVETTPDDDDDVDKGVARTASLKDGLRGERPVGLGCARMTSGSDATIEETTPVECKRTHNAEFVGVYVPPAGPYTTLTRSRWASYYASCRGLIAEYVGISVSTATRTAGVVAFPYSQAEWERGNRGVRCYLWLDKTNTSKSVKGAGAVPR
jgi:hypothetical protein